MNPVHVTAGFEMFAGKWVAVRRGQIIDVQLTPDAVVAALRDRGITDAAVVRIPAEDDPELVGLG